MGKKTQYKICGLDNIYVKHPWGGCGNKPYILKVLVDGEVYVPNTNTRRRFCDYYPPDDEYVIVRDNISDSFQNLSALCKKNRLLDGDIQWYKYAEDESYRGYVDEQAERWYDMLIHVDEYWKDYKATLEYKSVRNIIRDEILYYENVKKRVKRKRIPYDDETGRFDGKDIPKKIPLDEVR